MADLSIFNFSSAASALSLQYSICADPPCSSPDNNKEANFSFNLLLPSPLSSSRLMVEMLYPDISESCASVKPKDSRNSLKFRFSGNLSCIFTFSGITCLWRGDYHPRSMPQDQARNNTKNMEEINTNWLYSRGWTIRQASKAINRSYSHVSYVLRGERKSKAIARELKKLPVRTLNMRKHYPVSGN